MKKTEYTHSITLAVPVALIEEANCLACLMGETPGGNLNTFTAPSYTDGNIDYCVAHTVVKPVFLEPTVTAKLPPDPLEEMPEEYSRSGATNAFFSIDQPGGIKMAVDVNPHAQFEEWGLSRIETEEQQ